MTFWVVFLVASTVASVAFLVVSAVAVAAFFVPSTVALVAFLVVSAVAVATFLVASTVAFVAFLVVSTVASAAFFVVSAVAVAAFLVPSTVALVAFLVVSAVAVAAFLVALDRGVGRLLGGVDRGVGRLGGGTLGVLRCGIDCAESQNQSNDCKNERLFFHGAIAPYSFSMSRPPSRRGIRTHDNCERDGNVDECCQGESYMGGGGVQDLFKSDTANHRREEELPQRLKPPVCRPS